MKNRNCNIIPQIKGYLEMLGCLPITHVEGFYVLDGEKTYFRIGFREEEELKKEDYEK